MSQNGRSEAKREFPSDVVLAIFSFLDPWDWCFGAGMACKAWYALSEADALWSGACTRLWEGKANVKQGMPFPLARYHPSVEFSVKELKYLLNVRGVDISKLIEKAEYRAALVASDGRLWTTGLPMKGKWKASYGYSLRDSKRTYITDKELCEMEWTFFFKTNPAEFTAVARFEYDRISKQPRFLMNPWPMDNVNELPWRKNGRGDVVIHHFPGHMVFRRDDWSFGMENEHVIFFQSNTPVFNRDAVKGELLEALELEHG